MFHRSGRSAVGVGATPGQGTGRSCLREIKNAPEVNKPQLEERRQQLAAQRDRLAGELEERQKEKE
jgi:hypothetical protein